MFCTSMAYYIDQKYSKLKGKDKFNHLNKEEAQKKHRVHLLTYSNHDPVENRYDKCILNYKREI